MSLWLNLSRNVAQGNIAHMNVDIAIAVQRYSFFHAQCMQLIVLCGSESSPPVEGAGKFFYSLFCRRLSEMRSTFLRYARKVWIHFHYIHFHSCIHSTSEYMSTICYIRCDRWERYVLDSWTQHHQSTHTDQPCFLLLPFESVRSLCANAH